MENAVIENMSFEQLLGGIYELGCSQGSYGRLYNAIMELDEDEFLQIVKIPIPTVRALFRCGKFTDAKTVCALGHYFSQK